MIKSLSRSKVTNIIFEIIKHPLILVGSSKVVFAKYIHIIYNYLNIVHEQKNI